MAKKAAGGKRMAFEIKNGVLNKYNAESGEIRVIVPDEVTKINKEVFKNCTNVVSIVLPDSLTCIEEYAFSGCTSLIEIVIPESVTSIGERAIENCKSLVKI